MSRRPSLATPFAKIFRAVFVARRARARALSHVADRLGLATAQEVRTVAAEADLLLGRTRRERLDQRGEEESP